MQQALAASRQVERQPGLAELQTLQIDDIDVGEQPRRKHAAIVQAIEHRRIAALALDGILQGDTLFRPIPHPMLKHEGG